ncbi:iron ABC transporter permease [Helicobacter sp. MIT 21-1697]|uniref:FecCD family ABC transporter permease n=1 Tax=Helicobacter sp. MIT 21-1697 TaxID=2993733 RepID=UPI00224B6EA3|nr:iron ABC transporter permease [Helicobacter sp. MIT 21-1697]MCX2716801.1 iron ABC transporter permease [Helicobacter sp. MIT 21-1697]
MRKKIFFLCGVFALLVCACIIALGLGRFDIAYSDMFALVREYFENSSKSIDSIIFVEERLRRIIAALCVGGALALSGALYQGIIGNPLVSPSILGVLNGASFGAALGMVLGFGILGIEALCFVFGIVAMSVSVCLAHLFDKSMSILMLILGGMVSAAFFGAGVSALKLLADPYNTLPNIVFWLMGSLSSVQSLPLALLCAIFVVGCFLSVILASRIDLLNLDEESAMSLGINVKYARLLFVLLATLLASASVAVGGLIGWVGLICPHIARFVIGANHRFMLPFCILFGALFLLVCDSLARSALSTEIPLGIVSAVVGIPIFVALLAQRAKNV